MLLGASSQLCFSSTLWLVQHLPQQDGSGLPPAWMQEASHSLRSRNSYRVGDHIMKEQPFTVHLFYSNRAALSALLDNKQQDPREVISFFRGRNQDVLLHLCPFCRSLVLRAPSTALALFVQLTKVHLSNSRNEYFSKQRSLLSTDSC